MNSVVDARLKSATMAGLVMSALPVLLWPILAIPGAMALGSSQSPGCLSSWWASFICAGVLYPAAFIPAALLMWLLRRKQLHAAATVVIWLPFVWFATSAVFSGALGIFAKWFAGY